MPEETRAHKMKTHTTTTTPTSATCNTTLLFHLTMKPLEDTDSSVRASDDLSSQSSLEEVDYNSEDAFCEDLSESGGPPEVEILGMELLLSDEEQVDSDFADDSESDSSDEYEFMMRRTVDSLELTRKRLPHLVVRRHKRTLKRRKPRTPYMESLPGGEVDSLVLTRERLPHLIHKPDRIARLRELYEQGRGLFGEVDSLELDKKRLPHLIHERESSEESPIRPRKAFAELLEEIDGMTTILDLDFEEEVGYVKLTGESDDDSTATTESSTSDSDTLFTSGTVDSLILARKRLASHPARKYETDEHDHQAKPHTWTAAKHSETKIPPRPGVGISFGLRRTSSGACAA